MVNTAGDCRVGARLAERMEGRVLATPRLVKIVLACAILLPGHALAGPLARLGGAWAGQGTITTLTGLEHARCTADYRVDGDAASLDLRCASETYGLDLTSTVREERGRVTGTWAERRFGTSGAVSGRLDADRLTLVATVVGAQVSIVIAMSPARQTVSLRTTSPLVAGGDLVLARRR